MTKFAHLLTLLKWFCFYISLREYPNCFLRLFKQTWTSPHGWLNVTCDCYKEDKTWSEEKTHRHSWRLINQYVDQVESVAKPLMKSKPKSESPAIKKKAAEKLKRRMRHVDRVVLLSLLGRFPHPLQRNFMNLIRGKTSWF